MPKVPSKTDVAKPASGGWRFTFALLGVALAVVAALLVDGGQDAPKAGLMAAVATLMAVWWVFEVVPIPVTALLPLVLLPALGVAELGTVSASYGKSTIFLFLGGFILALGLQRSNLHRRIALAIMGAVGTKPSRLVLGFMVASASLSMWISNTASVMLMMPIGLSVLEEISERGVPKARVATLGTAIMLGIAYAADMGGMATLVGTPPNMVLLEMQGDLFDGAPTIGFGQWFLMGLPLAVVFLFFGWLLLSFVLFRMGSEPIAGSGQALVEARRALGRMTRDERLAGLVFGLTAVLWMTGADINLSPQLYIPGWRGALGLEQVGDPSVAIAGAIVLFMLPSAVRPGEMLMDWETARKVPWGILLLFGGGFALAAGFKTSGLSVTIGQALTQFEGAPPVVLALIVCLAITFLTELTSNTATTNLVLPILASAAASLGVDPRVLLIPATLSASCAFMMPVASPTQAIVFGSGYVSIKQMVRAGIWFNLLGVLLVMLVFFLIGTSVFDVAPSVVPDWAR